MADLLSADNSSFREHDISARCPNICKVWPSSDWHIEDVDAAGGIIAIMNEINKIEGLLNTDCMTVSGKTIGQVIASAGIKNTDCIHTLDNPPDLPPCLKQMPVVSLAFELFLNSYTNCVWHAQDRA